MFLGKVMAEQQTPLYSHLFYDTWTDIREYWDNTRVTFNNIFNISVIVDSLYYYFFFLLALGS